MKIFYCDTCNIIDTKDIFEEVCRRCGKIKKGDDIMGVEYSNVNELIINQNIYNMIFGKTGIAL